MMFGKIQIMIIRVTVEEVRVLEPLIIFSLAYLSYITAGMFSWSPIISLIGCGLVQVLIINISFTTSLLHHCWNVFLVSYNQSHWMRTCSGFNHKHLITAFHLDQFCLILRLLLFIIIIIIIVNTIIIMFIQIRQTSTSN